MKSQDYPLQLTVEDARDLVAAGRDALLVDVREPSEVAHCRIEGAMHIPMQSIPQRLAELDRGKHLLIYCHHGGRSLRVTQYLLANGFTKVSNVAGGIDAWSERIDPSVPRY